MEEIKEYVKSYYEIPDDISELQKTYKFNVSCQGSVPEAFACFFLSTSFEDCMRKVVSINGDTDTQCAIVGTVAEYVFGIPDDIKQETLSRLNKEQKEILDKFERFIK